MDRPDAPLWWFLPSLAFPVVLAFLLSACRSHTDIPAWFDGIQRQPLKTILVQGHRIAYLDAGDGPPVILVHGFGGSMWQWEYQQELASTHRVITLDFLGSGLSDKPDLAYTPTELIEFLRAFMDALNLPHAALAGNSMGAGIVMGMALTYPERVDRLVLISGLPDRVRDRLTSPLIKKALDNWLPVWMVNLGNRLSGRSVTRRVLSEMVYDESLLTPLVIDRSNRNRKRPGLLKPILTMAKHLPLWEEGLARRIHEIRHPTLVVWGDKDEVFPPGVGEDLHRRIAGARFTLVPAAGHIPMWERPELVNPELRRFLQP
ncbi:alpha/beta fold hydrolase [Candidatus Nitrospira bockiana]